MLFCTCRLPEELTEMFGEIFVNFDTGHSLPVIDELGKLYLGVIAEEEVDMIVLAIELNRRYLPFVAQAIDTKIELFQDGDIDASSSILGCQH